MSKNNDNSNVEDDEMPTKKLVASRAMSYCCFDTLIGTLQLPNRSTNSKAVPLTHDFVNELVDISVQCPLFVTWEKCNSGESNWQLRGCIGCLSPRPLATDVAEYAWVSAFRDRRFSPISFEEVRSLRVSVSLLVDYEDCKDVHDWTIGVHGILIKFDVNGQRYDGTFLPEVAKQQQWGHAKTISSLIQKAGYNATITQELLDGIHCTRYQSSKHLATYAEYVDDKCEGIHPISIPPSNKKATSRPWSSCKNM